MLTPTHFGLPSKFSSWRPNQWEAVDDIIQNPERFQTVCAPTGWGKSLFYTALAKMSGWRTVVLTSTKGLQDQLERDFGEISADVRGKSNYQCVESHNYGLVGKVTVEQGPCNTGTQCPKKAGGCEYYDRIRAAQRADIVVANYAMWMHDRGRGEDYKLNSLTPVELLVLDEAHDGPDQLADHVRTELVVGKDFGALLTHPGSLDQSGWKEWAAEVYQSLKGNIDGYKQLAVSGRVTPNMTREAGEWQRLVRKVERIAKMKGEWVIEEKEEWKTPLYGRAHKEKSVHFDPLWPRDYAESVLFQQVAKVVLVSATVRPKTAELIGVSSGTSRYREYQSDFPVARRPIIHVPTVRMNHRTGEMEHRTWGNRIDQIIRGRRERKGVIHTVSYQRAKELKEMSQYSGQMMTHTSSNRQQIVEQFKRSRPSDGMILVSPSVDTGYDFPYEECEYQIIGKVPFPDNRAKVIKRRMETDKEYSNYTTAQTVTQMVGRGMRAKDDQCETLVVDDNFTWFLRNNKEHFPKWFLDSVKWASGIPDPLPKLERS